ncbi:hypothetical protein [Pseudomonas sp. PvP001]|uniref:hypothetical protein n=1 Tax=Pseudomonas sp. PvP001 TaxID=3158559 RepID=UPI00106F78C0
MNALTRLLEVNSLPERPKAVAIHNPAAAQDAVLDVEGAYHGQTFSFRFGEITASHLKSGISIIVPSLTGHPSLPNEGKILLALTFENEQWQYSTDFVEGIYEGETLFITPQQLASFAGQTMAVDLIAWHPDLNAPAVWLTTFFELAFPNHMAQVAGAKNGVIDAALAARGSELLIPPYDGIEHGDEVVIYLLGRQSEGSRIFRVSIEENAVGQAISVPVSATLLQPSGNSTITIFYRVVTGGQTINGPLSTFFVESDSGVLVVADAVFTNRQLLSELSEESKVLFTVPQAGGQLKGADQTLFLWDEWESTRREYLLDTRSLDGPCKWSSTFFPSPVGSMVYTTTWISMGTEAVWAAAIEKVLVARVANSLLRGSTPCPSSASVETGTLVAPIVLEAIEGVVSEEAIHAGLTVSAPRPAQVPYGSYLSLRLKGYTAAALSVGALTTDDTVSWKVSGDTASMLINQVVSLQYFVEDGSGLRSEPTVLEFAVQRPPLQVLEARQNGRDIPVISVEAAEVGISVFLPPAPGLRAGDVVTVYWGGSAGKGHYVTSIPWTYEHQQHGLTLQIAPQHVKAHFGGQVFASYTVLALGREIDGPVSRFQVQPKVEAVDVIPLTHVGSAVWWVRDQASITLSKPLDLGIGDRVIWYVDTSPETALSVVAWRLEQVVSDPSLPIRAMIPVSLVKYWYPVEVRVFVVRADNEVVSCMSTHLVRLG